MGRIPNELKTLLPSHNHGKYGLSSVLPNFAKSYFQRTPKNVNSRSMLHNSKCSSVYKRSTSMQKALSFWWHWEWVFFCLGRQNRGGRNKSWRTESISVTTSSWAPRVQTSTLRTHVSAQPHQTAPAARRHPTHVFSEGFRNTGRHRGATKDDPLNGNACTVGIETVTKQPPIKKQN